jgi:pullulanase
LRGRLYSYLVELQVPGLGWVRQRVSDPYAVSLSANSQRAALLDLDDAALKPEGWDRQPRPRPGLRLHEMVVYELHVRDFSAAGSAACGAAWRGQVTRPSPKPAVAGMAHLRSHGAGRRDRSAPAADLRPGQRARAGLHRAAGRGPRPRPTARHSRPR